MKTLFLEFEILRLKINVLFTKTAMYKTSVCLCVCLRVSVCSTKLHVCSKVKEGKLCQLHDNDVIGTGLKLMLN